VDVLFLGSSRFGAALHEPTIAAQLQQTYPQRVPVVFNASVPAGDFVAMDYVLRQLLQTGIRPSCALVEINPGLVNHRNDWMAIHVPRQLVWADVPGYFADIRRANQVGRLLDVRLCPVYAYREDLTREIMKRIDAWTAPAPAAAGGTPARAEDGVPWKRILPGHDPRGLTPREITVIGRKAIQNVLQSYQVGGMSAASLEHVLETCRAAHIKVVLVDVPVTQEFRDCITPEIDTAYRSYVRELTCKYGCCFVDYRDQMPDESFMDIHHLTAEGGANFSRRVADEVLAPAWRETLAAGAGYEPEALARDAVNPR
jgi:hypothetical protein